jgi:rhodanese-related sulfurtransferase
VATATDGAGILAERVDAMLNDGFQVVLSGDVLDTPANYFLNNYWDVDDVTQYGLIDGAYRIKPLSLEDGEFMNYDPDETAVTYCWSGQTSSMITAYLNIIGYEAKSMKFGVNSLIFSELTGHKFPGSADYAYESTAPLAAQ